MYIAKEKTVFYIRFLSNQTGLALSPQPPQGRRIYQGEVTEPPKLNLLIATP